MASYIARRKFLATLGGAAAWSLAARAQQAAMPVIGFLHGGSPEPNVNPVAAFRKGLAEAGYVEGQNVTIEFRWAAGHDDRLPELAADLIRRRVAVIATPLSTQAALAAKAATTTIPIVFGTAGDPVALGLVTSFNRPGGNVTGISFMTAEIGAKLLGLLHELVPQAARFVALVNPTSSLAEPFIKDLQEGTRTLGLQADVLYAGTDREIDAAFANPCPKASRSRRALYQPPRPTRHVVPASRGALNLCHPRVCRSRRADELRAEPRECVSTDRRLYRPHP
jgi:putative ABC transport system substrate-binding protein